MPAAVVDDASRLRAVTMPPVDEPPHHAPKLHGRRITGRLTRYRDAAKFALPPVDVFDRRSLGVVLGSFLVHFIVVGSCYSVGVFVKPYQAAFDVGRGPASVVGALHAGGQFLFGFLTGRAGDVHGVHNTQLMGALIYIAGLLLASLSTDIWMVYATHGVICGYAASTMWFPAVSVVSQWFHKYRASMTGVAVAGSGLGNFVIPPLTEHLISEYGWAGALRRLAMIWSLPLLLCVLLLQRRLPRVKKNHRAGLIDWSSIQSWVADFNFRLMLAAGFFFNVGYFVIFVHLAPMMQDAGFGAERSAYLLGAIGIGSAVGRLVIGASADACGVILVFKITLAMVGLFLCFLPVLLSAEATFWAFAAWAFGYGFFAGGFIALASVVIAYLFGVVRLSEVMGLNLFGVGVGILVGPILAGVIFDATGRYDVTLVCAGLLVLVAVALLACFRLELAVGSKEEEFEQEERKAEGEETKEHEQDLEMAAREASERAAREAAEDAEVDAEMDAEAAAAAEADATRP